MEEAKRIAVTYAKLVSYLDWLRSSYEHDMLASVQFNGNVVHRWNACYQENQALRMLAKSYEKDIVSIRQRTMEVKEKLVETRSQIGSLVARNESLLAEKRLLEEQLNAVRNLLADTDSLSEEGRRRLAFLSRSSSNTSVEPASDPSLGGVDFDLTDESLSGTPEIAPGKISGSCQTLRKRGKSTDRLDPSVSQNDEIILKQFKLGPYAMSQTAGNPPLQGDSAPLVGNGLQPISLSENQSEHEMGKKLDLSASRLKHEVSPSESLFTVNSSGQIMNKKHSFFAKTVFFGETCDACMKKIGFGKLLLRCLDCGIKMHQQCSGNAFQHCVPRLPNMRCKRRLIDYIPSAGPFVPRLVVDLVREVERRGLDYSGLYRIPGLDSKVKNLMNNLLYNRGYSDVQSVDDVAVLTGCLKKFFQQLAEPLIPYASRADFLNIASADIERSSQMKRIHKEIVELPLPNRDTLTFLTLHLQKVSDHSETNKMPITNLAKVFGPTLFGCASQTSVSLSHMLEETRKQEKVMELLLSLPRDYWQQFANRQPESPLAVDTYAAPGISEAYASPAKQDA
uniref:Rho-GAP domain-containing protein n=1 Tax=Trichuris muris TaxID=70415 RepID=A0A5S6QMV8_TRIMR